MRRAMTIGLTLAVAASTAVTTTAVASDGGRSGPGGQGGSGKGLTAFGLADDGTELVRFSTSSPSRVHEVADLDLSGDDRLVGIDVRVADGALYGVGDRGGVYRIDPRTGDAELRITLSVPLSGERFGVDVNPAADALRVVSDDGQNLRQAFAGVDAGTASTVVDGPLTYPAAGTTPAATAVGVTGAGYTNNDADAATATTLFDVDTERDQVVVQSPANSGLLAATGALGVDADADSGFDVATTARKGETTGNQAFLVTGGRLYAVDLLTGGASALGQLGDRSVTDIALLQGQR